jgi:serine/threonine-protein kinase
MLGIDPRDWPVVNVLLDRAMDLPPESRGAWLDALPPESAAYRDTLMRLLAAEGGVETNAIFAELPRVDVEAIAADDGDAALVTGSRVGPCVLLSQIGRGGMGSVWLAERSDGQPRRKVALKLPHLGWTPGLAERVERERDILASRRSIATRRSMPSRCASG